MTNMGSTTKLWARGLIVLCLTTAGCRTDSEDVQRWANTQQGPRKLVAVLVHGKYPRPLRVEAAMTLIGMRARGGRRVGIDQTLEALAAMDASERDRLVAALVPELIAKLGEPAPAAGASDESLPYKDAAFELLTHTGPKLLERAELEQPLRHALSQWAMADFVTRMSASGQQVSMQQMLQELGPTSVVGLPDLIERDTPKLDHIAQLIAELGDEQTKLRASQKLVELARFIASDQWLNAKRPELEQANAASGQAPDPQAFAKQLALFQEEELLRLFGSMRRIGGKPSVDFLLTFAREPRSEKQRKGALAAVERQIDGDDSAQLETIVAIASDDNTPDAVRGLALRRMGELPRDKVAAPLLGLFEHQNWKVRWLAAELLLQMSEPQHVDEFMAKLAKVEHMSLTEPLRYGQLIGEMKGTPAPEELVDSYSSSSNKVPVRLAALGYYYAHGDAADLAKLERAKRDRKKLPSCAEDAQDCEWRCAGRDVSTVGEFVEHCIVPSIEARNSGPTRTAGVKPSQDPQKTQ